MWSANLWMFFPKEKVSMHRTGGHSASVKKRTNACCLGPNHLQWLHCIKDLYTIASKSHRSYAELDEHHQLQMLLMDPASCVCVCVCL